MRWKDKAKQHTTRPKHMYMYMYMHMYVYLYLMTTLEMQL